MDRPLNLLLPATPAVSWSQRNQRWLSDRFAAWCRRIESPAESLRLGATDESPGEPDGFEPAALRLVDLFGLTSFEADILLLALGMEIDSRLRAAVTSLQEAMRLTGRLRFSTAMALSATAHWDALSPAGQLRHWSLVDFDAGAAFADGVIRIDERVQHYLTGVAALDARLRGYARLAGARQDESSPAGTASGADDTARRIAAELMLAPAPVVVLAESQASAASRQAARKMAQAALSRAGLATIWLDAQALAGVMATAPSEADELIRRIDREAALSGAGVVLVNDAGPTASPAASARLVAVLRSPTIVIGALTPLDRAELGERSVFHVAAPDVRETSGDLVPVAMRRVAERALQQFRVEPELLRQALRSVAVDDDAAGEHAVWDALRQAARGGLDALAARIDSRTTFDDLVVPPMVSAQLHEIADQLRQRQRVYDDWGFGAMNERGLGIAALFAGESGTGKTLAAEAIANEARLDLYRVDLASVVSKYIGETEKNLSRLFDAAERSGAVLLFDEADALFGKRSEVKDSHDRYANVEVAYLLQRIESYRGLAILTSNLKSSLDRAFLRRIRFVVQFPFPDEKARARIWRRQFPARAPLGEIDFDALARLQLAGGHIRSVALNAAFNAAARGVAIGQPGLMNAARSEFAKMERQFSTSAGGSP